MAKIKVFVENSNTSKAMFYIQLTSFILIFVEMSFPDPILPEVDEI